MCGRFSQNFNKQQRAVILFRNLTSADLPFHDRYNIAPTQHVPLILGTGTPKVETLYWGLIPSWFKDMKTAAININARAETVDSKPTFRDAFKKRRCLVPASGFYEWHKSEDGKTKTPYYFTAADGESPLMFAGLWETWDKMGQEIHSFTIITTEANETVAPYHDRMPVILPPDKYEEWLYPTKITKDILAPAGADVLQSWQVSTYVNSPKNEGEKAIERVA